MVEMTMPPTKTLAFTPTVNQPKIVKLLAKLLDEVHALRTAISPFLPEEDLEEYAHPKQIRRAYALAAKRYPPSSVWK